MSTRKPRSARKGKSNVVHQRNSAALLIGGGFAAAIGLVLGLVGMLAIRGVRDRGTVFFIVFCAIGVITGVSCVGGWFYRATMLPRLVFRKDRVEYLRGKDTVIGNIPYDNIHSVELGQRTQYAGYDSQRGQTITFETSFLTILLWEREDEDTWWPGFAPRRRDSEVVINPGFEKRGWCLLMIARPKSAGKTV